MFKNVEIFSKSKVTHFHTWYKHWGHSWSRTYFLIDKQLPSRLQSITAHWPVTNYTAMLTKAYVC